MNPYNVKIRPPAEWDCPPGHFQNHPDSWAETARQAVWAKVGPWIQSEDYQTKFQRQGEKCQSPIEHLMQQAISHEAVCWMTPPGRWPGTSTTRVAMITQCWVDEYVVDFMLRFRDERAGSVVLLDVVVECDGHNYHSKTRDQANRDRTRDRAFVRLDVPVLRFTSDEIFSHPVSCASEVFSTVGDTLDRLHHERVQPREQSLWEQANIRHSRDRDYYRELRAQGWDLSWEKR